MTHSYILHLNTVKRIKKVFGYASNDMLKTPVLLHEVDGSKYTYSFVFIVHKKKNPLDVWIDIIFLKHPVLVWMVWCTCRTAHVAHLETLLCFLMPSIPKAWYVQYIVIYTVYCTWLFLFCPVTQWCLVLLWLNKRREYYHVCHW